MTILDYQVSASSDDAEEKAVDGNVCVINNSSLGYLANLNTTGNWNGFRFLNVTIPNGVTITAAYLSFYLPNSALDEPDVLIYGLDNASPGTFFYAINNISGRARTTASVNWSSTGLGSSAGWYNTSSIVSIIEELMASYSYASGSSMGFVMTSRIGTTTRDLRVSSYDLSGDTTKAAKLHIEYSSASASVVPVVMRQYRQRIT